jgi:7-cyano-7-deazaguanine synthase
MSPPRPPAVVLLSGGLDSATVLAMALDRGFAVHALSFRYGQRHLVELDCAGKLARTLGASSHSVVDFDLRAFGGSALTGDLPVPKHRSDAAIGEGIPATYVPARNTIFLAFALARAETLDCRDLFIGVNALDYSGYPDCRPEFVAAFEALANLGTRAGVEGGGRIRVHAPLIRWTKAEIIRQGLALGVDYALTSSCYDPAPDGAPCRACDACVLRHKGFSAAGIADPLLARHDLR